tara:strand:- start:39514 stop:39852 length:339 start_codon:yes stop_codon:yes gene_type:complete
MTALDQLADRLVPILDPDALDPVAQEQARNVADAVIGMVRPLEWDANHAPTKIGLYAYYKGFAHPNGAFVVQYDEKIICHAHSAEAAIAAANAHRLAQWLSVIGLDAGEGQL